MLDPNPEAEIWQVEPKVLVTLPAKKLRVHANLDKTILSAQIELYSDGYATIESYTGFGDVPEDSYKRYEQERDVIDWLVEWELLCWRKIGPEDMEIFATKKLDEEWGLE